MTPAELKAIRHRLALNTADFGARVGVSGRAVEKWEQGVRKIPRPVEMLINLLKENAMNEPTLEKLNETDDPKSFGGELLGNDGQGNQLWLFRSIDKVANRYSEDGEVEWSGDIEGWNYTDDFALE